MRKLRELEAHSNSCIQITVGNTWLFRQYSSHFIFSITFLAVLQNKYNTIWLFSSQYYTMLKMMPNYQKYRISKSKAIIDVT